jgi:hypothetical protein
MAATITIARLLRRRAKQPDTLSLASSGDTIMAAAGNYVESITIPFSLSILGAGPHKSYLGGSSQSTSVVTIPSHAPSSQVVLSGFTIFHGYSPLDGGGISNWGQLMVRDNYHQREPGAVWRGHLNSQPIWLRGLCFHPRRGQERNLSQHGRRGRRHSLHRIFVHDGEDYEQHHCWE